MDGPRRAAVPVTSPFQEFDFEVTGLRGKRMRVLVDIPTDDAGVPQDLPAGATDVIALDDEVGPNLSIGVHLAGDPAVTAYVRYDQLALYTDQ
jgi:hypothetical protein